MRDFLPIVLVLVIAVVLVIISAPKKVIILAPKKVSVDETWKAAAIYNCESCPDYRVPVCAK